MIDIHSDDKGCRIEMHTLVLEQHLKKIVGGELDGDD